MNEIDQYLIANATRRTKESGCCLVRKRFQEHTFVADSGALAPKRI